MSPVRVKWVQKYNLYDGPQPIETGPVTFVPVVELAALREVVEAAVEAEDELPGEIPQEMYDTIIQGDKATVAETLRIVVRATKKSITERLLAQLGEVPK